MYKYPNGNDKSTYIYGGVCSKVILSNIAPPGRKNPSLWSLNFRAVRVEVAVALVVAVHRDQRRHHSLRGKIIRADLLYNPCKSHVPQNPLKMFMKNPEKIHNNAVKSNILLLS